MNLGGIRRLYLPLRPKARFSTGRKTPPGVSAPSAGLRPLIVSRVKCGGGPCPVPRKPPPESSVPGEKLTRGSRRNQLRRGHGSPPVLSEVPHELSTDAHSKECKRSPQQFIPAGFPLHDNLSKGTEDSDSPLTTPDMVRSGRVLQTSVKFPIPHNFSSESDKTAPAFHSPPRSATEAALSGLRSGL